MSAPTKPRVLLVEDEEAHAELVCRSLEDEAEVFLARDLASARSRLQELGPEQIDLVLTDLRLPDGLGVSLLEREDEIPIVVLTSQGDERDAVDAIKRGAYDYIVKSVVAFEEMPRIAERVLREWRHMQEQDELRCALAEQERLAAVGTAAAMLAHEIGNPLNSMSLSAQLIERRLRKLGIDVSEISEMVGTCRREISRLAELLAEFRGLARESDLRLAPIELRGLVARALSGLRPALDDAQVELVVHEFEATVLANEGKLTQVLVNLCKNALEAMPDGGQIDLRASVAGDTVELTVEDNGPGLPPDVDVFAPLTTTKEHGTGLGLAVVAQIMASHGGAIRSRDVDGGACFVLTLQRADPDAG